MNTTEHIPEQEDASLLSNLGENFHYFKTIITNRVEITKLEFVQLLIDISGLLIKSIIGIFIAAIITLIFIATAVVFLAQLLNSYIYALLIVNAIIIFLGVISYLVLRPLLSKYIEQKIISKII